MVCCNSVDDEKKSPEDRSLMYRGIHIPLLHEVGELGRHARRLPTPVIELTPKRGSTPGLIEDVLVRLRLGPGGRDLMDKVEHRILQAGYQFDPACKREFGKLIRKSIRKVGPNHRHLPETNIIHLVNWMIAEVRHRGDTLLTKNTLHEVQRKLVCHYPYF